MSAPTAIERSEPPVPPLDSVPLHPIVLLSKQCNCRGTSSGPRIVTSRQVEKNGAYTMTVSFVEMACDVCDTPWKRQEPNAKLTP